MNNYLPAGAPVVEYSWGWNVRRIDAEENDSRIVTGGIVSCVAVEVDIDGFAANGRAK